MTADKSVMTFEKYTIDEFVLKRNDKIGVKDFEIEFDFSASVELIEEENRAKTSLECVIFGEEFENNQAPFYIKTVIVGHFECEGEASIDDFEFNGMAILMPYLRAYITTVTAQAGIDPVIIPPINVYNYFKRKEK